MELMIFLTDEGKAYGDVYFDDGDSIDAHVSDYSFVTFEAGAGFLLNVPTFYYYQDISFNIEKISIAGVKEYISGR